MTAKEFDAVVKECTDRMTKMLCSTKADEYNQNKDNRFDTFYHAAEIGQVTPERALTGFRLKHDVSMNDMLKEIEKGKKFPRSLVIEKLIDICNYNVLLYGLLIDEGKLTED